MSAAIRFDANKGFNRCPRNRTQLSVGAAQSKQQATKDDNMPTNPALSQYKVRESNVFFMTRFRDTEYHEEISRSVREAIRAFGLEFLRADDRNFTAPTLWDMVQACMDAASLGIAVFESIDEADFNPNVSLELGYMMALQRQCLLLKERKLKSLPTDLCGHLYKEFDSRSIAPTILGRIADWLKEIGVRKRDDERLVVFVSTGGTCRCAMAKAVTRYLLEKTKEGNRIRVESRAAVAPSHAGATEAAQIAVRDKLGVDLLGNHRPRRAGVAFLYEADLILATDQRQLERVRSAFEAYPGSPSEKETVRIEIARKSHLITEFFGGTGDIDDPWPDDGTPAAHGRYKQSMDSIYDLIVNRLSALTSFVSTASPAPPVSFGDRSLLS